MAINETRAHRPNWGVIVTIVLALIPATWWAAVQWTRAGHDIEEFKDNLTTVQETIGELLNEVETVTEVVQKLQATNQQDSVKAEENRTQVATAARREEPTTGSLREFCDGPSTTSDDQTIMVGQSVKGELSEDDTLLEDETYVDNWVLPVCESGRITVEMKSPTLDSFIFLLSLAQFEIVDTDDDSGDGVDAHLTADVSAGFYVVSANTWSSALGERTGPYTLSVH